LNLSVRRRTIAFKSCHDSQSFHRTPNRGTPFYGIKVAQNAYVYNRTVN